MVIRWRYIVKPKLQIQYLITALIIVVITSAAVYMTLLDTLYKSTALVEMTHAEFQKLKSEYTKSLITVIIIVAIIIALQNIFFFHRVAGPIHVFEKVIRMLSDGYIPLDFKLRKTDELKDLAGEIQQMCLNFKKYITEDREKLNKVHVILDDIEAECVNMPELKEKISYVKGELRTITQRFRFES